MLVSILLSRITQESRTCLLPSVPLFFVVVSVISPIVAESVSVEF